MSNRIRLGLLSWSGRTYLAAASRGTLDLLGLAHDHYVGPQAGASIYLTLKSVLLEALSKLSGRSTISRLTPIESLLLRTALDSAVRVAQIDQEDHAVVDLQRLQRSLPKTEMGRVPREHAARFVVRDFLCSGDLLTQHISDSVIGAGREAA
jgi:hypothetical protein